MAVSDDRFSSTVGCLTKGKWVNNIKEVNHQSRYEAKHELCYKYEVLLSELSKINEAWSQGDKNTM